MKCPYREFQDCIVEKCPSCNYEEEKRTVIDGIYPAYMSAERAMEEGYAWKRTETTYKFLSCKLVDNNVQPVPANKTVVNNNQRTSTSVLVKRSIF